MSRKSNNDYDGNGILRNGFDYDLQAWVINYVIQPCGHKPQSRSCCNQGRLAGQDLRSLNNGR